MSEEYDFSVSLSRQAGGKSKDPNSKTIDELVKVFKRLKSKSPRLTGVFDLAAEYFQDNVICNNNEQELVNG